MSIRVIDTIKGQVITKIGRPGAERYIVRAADVKPTGANGTEFSTLWEAKNLCNSVDFPFDPKLKKAQEKRRWTRG